MLYKAKGKKRIYGKSLSLRKKKKTFYSKGGKYTNANKSMYNRKITRADLGRQANLNAQLANACYSTLTHTWTQENSTNTTYDVFEVCPYRLDEAKSLKNEFWRTEGGAITIDKDMGRIYVRGGEWRLTITNLMDHDVLINAYMSFIKTDGGDNYTTITGRANTKWTPYMAGDNYTNCFSKGKWERESLLKKKETVIWKFRISKFALKTSNWFSEKKNWPFLHIESRPAELQYKDGVPEYPTKLKCTVERIIIYAEGFGDFKNTQSQVEKIQKDWENLRTIIANSVNSNVSPDTTMNT